MDLELVYESVFDADTIPMIFIAEEAACTGQRTSFVSVSRPRTQR